MPPASQAGFSLVEVLVAFAILAVASILALGGFSQGLAALSRAETDAVLTEAARSLLSTLSVRMELAEGTTRGTTADGLSWSLEVRPQQASPEPAWTQMRAYAVTLRIAEGEELSRGLSLSTVLVARPAP